MKAATLNRIAIASLLGLIVLALAWEAWLAPLRPGGSWLMVKALPLTAPVNGILHGRVYTHQWAAMLSLVYLAEGIVRALTDHGTSARLAVVEIALVVCLFLACIFYVRASRRGSLP